MFFDCCVYAHCSGFDAKFVCKTEIKVNRNICEGNDKIILELEINTHLLMFLM